MNAKKDDGRFKAGLHQNRVNDGGRGGARV